MIDVVISRAGVGKRGLLWDAWLGDRKIVERSVDPEHDAARVLVAEGFTGAMAVRHLGSKWVSTVHDLERAAGLRSFDADTGGPRTRKWTPYDRPDPA